jgi:uncharacterized phage-associated protein
MYYQFIIEGWRIVPVMPEYYENLKMSNITRDKLVRG